MSHWLSQNIEKIGGAGVPARHCGAQWATPSEGGMRFAFPPYVSLKPLTRNSKLFQDSSSWAFGTPIDYEKLWRHANLFLPTMAEGRNSVMLRARKGSLTRTSPRTLNCCLLIKDEHAEQTDRFAMSAIVEFESSGACRGDHLPQVLRFGRS
jgi:hypothetical protein